MSVSGTSKEAYAKLRDKLGDKQLKVFEAIDRLGVASNEAIADHLGWPINRVTGRVSELKKFGFIDVEGLGKNKSGFSAKLWSVRNRNDKELERIANDCEG
jgi:predicted transcriptional regulator